MLSKEYQSNSNYFLLILISIVNNIENMKYRKKLRYIAYIENVVKDKKQ